VTRRVFATISDGEQVMTEEEALALCDAWGTSDAADQAEGSGRRGHGAPSAVDAGAAASSRIPADVFLRLLSTPSGEAQK